MYQNQSQNKNKRKNSDVNLFKSSYSNQGNVLEQVINQIFDVLMSFIFFAIENVCDGIFIIFKLKSKQFYFLAAYMVLSYILSFIYAFIYLKDNAPGVFQLIFYSEHHAVFFVLSLFVGLMLLGFIYKPLSDSQSQHLKKAGLKNGVGDTPLATETKKIDENTIMYGYELNGISLEEFKNKAPNLASSHNLFLDRVERGKSASSAVIYLTKQEPKVPDYVSFKSLEETEKLEPGEFYIGKTRNGIIKEKLADIPHVLISGVTKAGKSVFFKQMIMGLLESREAMHLYLLDLKFGLEFKSFSSLPNAVCITNIEQSAQILRKARKEMYRRFEYMKENNITEIDPEKEKMERIVISCDEASLLFQKRDSEDPNFEYVKEARFCADELGKLGRAAAINLVFATQKIEANVIPTIITNNLDGRMVFKAGNMQASITMLGTKEAMHIDTKLRGEGIWNFGIDKENVRAPHIGAKEIYARCARIAIEFKQGQRVMYSQLMVNQARQLPKFNDLSIEF